MSGHNATEHVDLADLAAFEVGIWLVEMKVGSGPIDQRQQDQFINQ